MSQWQMMTVLERPELRDKLYGRPWVKAQGTLQDDARGLDNSRKIRARNTARGTRTNALKS